ncbi:hypothetical protein EYF80_042828 [Liparis tanakae]|uniref:Secreted protein n=1 Tax=Liparis tanakae TaxID=230148 RepID=A0A4Z2G0C7_9TELE|nr:hypothetical protein EYF80_042828 [Liparis tanakae]
MLREGGRGEGGGVRWRGGGIFFWIQSSFAVTCGAPCGPAPCGPAPCGPAPSVSPWGFWGHSWCCSSFTTRSRCSRASRSSSRSARSCSRSDSASCSFIWRSSICRSNAANLESV